MKKAFVKLTESEKGEILQAYCTGRFTQKELAEEYFVSVVTIGNICRGTGLNRQRGKGKRPVALLKAVEQ